MNDSSIPFDEKHHMQLTPEYFKQICPYTGLKNDSSQKYISVCKSEIAEKASLDRSIPSKDTSKEMWSLRVLVSIWQKTPSLPAK